MVRKWVAVVLVAVAVGVAGCSSDGGGGDDDFTMPKLAGKDWTPAGLAATRAATDAIVAAMPGQCTDAGVSVFSDLAFGMERVRSRVIPTGQMTCTVSGEVVEITAFRTKADRDRFLDDRSNGLCRLAKAQAEKYDSRLQFPGLRWDVGAGNLTLQPDSQSLARKLASITNGRYDGRPCAKGITVDWDSSAINAIDALGRKISAAGHGCPQVNLVPREGLDTSSKFTNAQLPAALGGCTFDTMKIELITYDRTTPQVEEFVAGRIRQACVGDPATGRIDGDGFTIVAPGTIAEQVHTVVGGELAATSCGE